MRQNGRGLAELHCVVFDDHVALDAGVPRARTSAVRACRTTLECVAFFRKTMLPWNNFSSTVLAVHVAFLSSARTC